MFLRLFHGCFLILLMFFVSGCNDDDPVQDEVTKAGPQGHSDSHGELTEYIAPEPVDGAGKKLFAIYMVGSDLEDGGDNAGTKDFIELLDGYDSLSDVERSSIDIVVAFGGSTNWPGMRIANIDQLIADYDEESDVDDLDNLMGDLKDNAYLYYAPKAHMGDASSLKLFLKYLEDGYANHDVRFLDMWDHGAAYSQFGNDSNYNFNGLTLRETMDSFSSIDSRFDAIGYDACLNANFEIAAAVKDSADYMIASVETEPGHGWDYENVLPLFVRSASVESFGRQIVDDFVSNPDHADTDGKTLSIIDLRHYEKVSDALTQFSDSISGQLSDPAINDLIRKAHDPHGAYGVEGFGKGRRGRRGRRASTGSTFDLNGLAKVFNDGGTGIVKDNAQMLLDALEEYEIYSKADATRQGASGVTIAPLLLLADSDDLKEEQFPNKSYWNLMNKVHETYVKNDSTGPVVLAARNAGASSDFQFKKSHSNHILQRFAAKDDTGTYASFSDANMASVVTGYANILEDPVEGKIILMLGELPAVATGVANEYYTPKWNGNWFLMKVGPEPEDETPLFLRYDGKSTNPDTGEVLERFSAEIDFQNPGRDYSNQEDKFDYARFEVLVDKDNNVVSNKISPFKMIYSSADDAEGHPVFEKYGKPLKTGDRISIYSEAIVASTGEFFWNLETLNPENDDWLDVKETPTFEYVPLEFEGDDGELLKYYYLMRARDMAGNVTDTDPQLVN